MPQACSRLRARDGRRAMEFNREDVDALSLESAVRTELHSIYDTHLQIEHLKKLEKKQEEGAGDLKPLLIKRREMLETQLAHHFEVLEQIDPDIGSKLKAIKDRAPDASSGGEAPTVSELSGPAADALRSIDEQMDALSAEMEALNRGDVLDVTWVSARAAHFKEALDQILDVGSDPEHTNEIIVHVAKVIAFLNTEAAVLRGLEIGAVRSRMRSLPQRLDEFVLGNGPVEKDECADPTLDEKKKFSHDIYRLKQEQLGLLVEMLDNLCPDAIEKSNDISINIDAIPPRVFRECASQVEVWLDEPVAEPPPPPPKPLTGAAALLETLDKFRAENGGVDDPYYAAMRGALEELEIEEREERAAAGS